MQLINFHHHFPDQEPGIYNLVFGEHPKSSYFSAGIHPKEINHDYDFQLNWLNKIAVNQHCVAIGECGLDTFSTAAISMQKEILLAQIKIAEKNNKPLIIHCVRAFPQLIEAKKTTQVAMAIHGFRKKRELSLELIRHGFYLSFGKALLYDLSLQQTFTEIPADKYFLETDNSDVQILEIYEKAAELKSCSVEKMAKEIENNFNNFLRNI